PTRHHLTHSTTTRRRNSERFPQTLRSATHLTQVRFMPSLLVPEKRTVPYLREAAARFQADLLLVYTTRVQTFRQDRFFGTDEVRARCIVESVLQTYAPVSSLTPPEAPRVLSPKNRAGTSTFQRL